MFSALRHLVAVILLDPLRPWPKPQETARWSTASPPNPSPERGTHLPGSGRRPVRGQRIGDRASVVEPTLRQPCGSRNPRCGQVGDDAKGLKYVVGSHDWRSVSYNHHKYPISLCTIRAIVHTRGIDRVINTLRAFVCTVIRENAHLGGNQRRPGIQGTTPVLRHPFDLRGPGGQQQPHRSLQLVRPDSLDLDPPGTGFQTFGQRTRLRGHDLRHVHPGGKCRAQLLVQVRHGDVSRELHLGVLRLTGHSRRSRPGPGDPRTRAVPLGVSHGHPHTS